MYRITRKVYMIKRDQIESRFNTILKIHCLTIQKINHIDKLFELYFEIIEGNNQQKAYS